MARILSLWRQAISPPLPPPNTQEYRRYSVLLLVIISLLVTAGLLFLLVPLLVSDHAKPSVYAACGFGVIWFSIVYYLARQGHYNLSATATAGYVTLAICAATFALQQETPVRFLALSSILGVMLFPRIGALSTLGLNMLAAVITTQLLSLELRSILLDNLLPHFMLSLALLIVVETNETHRQNIEGQSQALIEAQKRELAWLAENERARVMREWVAYMSHDFRTPLAVMGTTLYVMERNFKPELNPQRIKTLTHQVDRLSALVSNMHAAVSLEGKVAPHLQVQDLTPLITDIMERLSPLATERKVNLGLQIESPLPPVPVDSDAFRLAFHGLLENAVLYNKSGGQVSVRSHLNRHYLHLVIEDTGIGIPDHDLPFIFDRFYRVDKARQIDLGRNGLGLSIAKLVVEAHQGRIEVKSVLGQGSTFTLFWPLSLADGEVLKT